MEDLKKLLISMLLTIVFVINSGLIFMILWNLLIEPNFNIFELTLIKSVGIILVYDLIKPKPRKIEGEFKELIIESFSRAVAYWIIYIPIGFILSVII